MPARRRAASSGCARGSRTPTPSIFGHSHIPLHERAADGFQIFNPGSPTERRRAPHHTMGIAHVGARALRVRARSSSTDRLQAADGPLDLLRRHRRLDPDRPPRPARAARAPRRRPDPVRLRRGDPAPARQLGRADRPDRDLPHPLPRRPLARPAGDAQDVRPARPRPAAGDPRAAAGCATLLALGAAAGRPGRASSSTWSSSSPATCSSATATGSRRCRSPIAARRSATCCSRTSGRACSTRRRRGALGARRRGRSSGACSAARRSAASRPSRCSGPPRPGRKLVISGDTAPCEALRIAAHRADVLVHEATFAEEERERAAETGHSTAEPGGDDRARGGGARCWRSPTSRRATRSGVLRDEARAVFPRHGAARATSTRSRSRSPSGASRSSCAGMRRPAEAAGGRRQAEAPDRRPTPRPRRPRATRARSGCAASALGPEHATELAALLLRPARLPRRCARRPSRRPSAEVRASLADKRAPLGAPRLRPVAAARPRHRRAGRPRRPAVHRRDRRLDEVEAAWAIVPERWGEGLATELALRLGATSAFDTLELARDRSPSRCPTTSPPGG